MEITLIGLGFRKVLYVPFIIEILDHEITKPN